MNSPTNSQATTPPTGRGDNHRGPLTCSLPFVLGTVEVGHSARMMSATGGKGTTPPPAPDLAAAAALTASLPRGTPLAQSMPRRGTPGCPPGCVTALPGASWYVTTGHRDWEAMGTPPPHCRPSLVPLVTGRDFLGGSPRLLPVIVLSCCPPSFVACFRRPQAPARGLPFPGPRRRRVTPPLPCFGSATIRCRGR